MSGDHCRYRTWFFCRRTMPVFSRRFNAFTCTFAAFSPAGVSAVGSDAALLIGVRAAVSATKSATIASSTAVFFLQLLEAEQPAPAVDKRVRQALLYMQDHLAEELDLVKLASKASLSLSQFKQLFRQQLGRSQVST